MSNLSQRILEYLKEYQRVEILGFGVFELKNSGAKKLRGGVNLLPPALEVFFDFDKEIQGEDFISFLSEKEKISKESAQEKIQDYTTKWLEKLENKMPINLKNIGNFVYENSKLVFYGERLVDSSPEFFGLEKVEIEPLNEIISLKKSKKKKRIFWIIFILCLFGILAFFYFGGYFDKLAIF